MSLANRVQSLVDSGEYRDALAALMPYETVPDELEAVKLFLESQSGDLALAQQRAERLLETRQSPHALAIYNQIVGRSILVHGRCASDGLKHCAEALAIASRSLSRTLCARYTGDFVATLLHRVGINEVASELHRLRLQALASGDALALISAHLVQAEVRVKQARYMDALAELCTVDALLVRRPHVIFEARRHLVASAIESTNGTVSRARRHAEFALSLADRSGALSLRIPVLGTLAHVLLAGGDFSGCAHRLDDAFRLAHPGGSALVVLNDTKFQLLLASGDALATRSQADFTHALSGRFSDGLSYYGLWHSRSRAKWLLQIGRADEALALVDSISPAVERSGDRDLQVRMGLIRAEALGASDRSIDGASCLSETLGLVREPSLEIVGEASRVAGCLCKDEPGIAAEHFERSARVFEAMGHIPARADVLRLLQSLGQADDEGRLSASQSAFCRAMASAAAMTFFRRNVALLASEVRHVVESAGAGVCDLGGSNGGLKRRAGRTVHLPLDQDSDGAVLAVHFPASAIARIVVGGLDRILTAILRAGVSQGEALEVAIHPDLEAEPDLVFEAPAMRKLVEITKKVGSSNATVLITGETGTGKEVLARAVHRASGRPFSAFFPFNCTALPRELLDGQLFGYKKGSFTGAFNDYQGLIASANGGTLFLDEVGEMPLEVQPKLLRFLESGEILPIGQAHVSHVNVRVIAATNANLEALVASGRFREDLFYRLKVVPLRIPPLRERREEIPMLVRSISARLAREAQTEPLRFSDASLDFMAMYDWPGNVRELANELRRILAVSTPGEFVRPVDLSPEIVGGDRRGDNWAQCEPLSDNRDEKLASAVRDLERRMIKGALDRFAGSPTEAARSLGLSRKGLFLKRRRLGFD